MSRSSKRHEELLRTDRAVLAYDHRDERYELVHFDHRGLEATIPFVAVDVGDRSFRLLRRREIGSRARGVEIEGDPREAFGDVGELLARIAHGQHPEEADHVC